MKILTLGGGGREHAIVWALSKSHMVDEIHCMPGNGGIQDLAILHEGDHTNPDEVLSLSKRINPDLVVIGPEAPLVNGVADVLRQEGYSVFGPNKAGARLEGSKAFAKTFMKRNNIPTASFDVCTQLPEAMEALKKRTAPYVVKADGLAAGKGAFVLQDLKEAQEICEALLNKNYLKEAGKTIVVEDFLPGRELTVLVITDGSDYIMLPPSQDHKRAWDNDKGPNTGGMGAYAPVPWVDKKMTSQIEKTIVKPTIDGLKKENIPFKGVLYCGLMIDEKQECRVLEYNVRMGDPETQVVLPIFEGDLAETMLACSKGSLKDIKVPLVQKAAVGVVIASGGYPSAYKTGFEIHGIEKLSNVDDIIIFHAGTKKASNKYYTTGGRVLTVVGIGGNIEEARKKVYKNIEVISFEGHFYRKDIAARLEGPNNA
ncbi:MAG: phosphoribosylamine--glycine ligase [Thermovirga sp.]|nr:phosphoribosylamine--glycine ligase [Thermovirga sp.]